MSFKLNCTLKKRQKRAGANLSLNKHKYVWEKRNLAPSLHRECLCHNTQIHTQIIIPQLHMIVWSFFCYKNKSAQWIWDLSHASFFPWLHKIICFIFSQTLFKKTVNHQIIFLNLIFWQLILQRHFSICSVSAKICVLKREAFHMLILDILKNLQVAGVSEGICVFLCLSLPGIISIPASRLQDISVSVCGIWYHPNSHKTLYNPKKHHARKPL